MSYPGHQLVARLLLLAVVCGICAYFVWESGAWWVAFCGAGVAACVLIPVGQVAFWRFEDRVNEETQATHKAYREAGDAYLAQKVERVNEKLAEEGKRMIEWLEQERRADAQAMLQLARQYDRLADDRDTLSRQVPRRDPLGRFISASHEDDGDAAT